MDTSEGCALRGGQAPAGQVWVEGYTTSRGVRVEGHFRAHQRRTETATQPDAAAAAVKVPAAGAVAERPQPRLVMAHSPAITTAGVARDEMDAAGEVADGSGSGRCPMCGQYAATNHDCPARPENLPEANYKGIPPKDRVEVMLADLDQSVQAIVESGQLEAWLDVMASNGMSRWSANNRLLAIMQLYQRGDSLENVHLMGFKQWKEFGRSVNDGAKAVWVLAPVTRRLTTVDSNGDENEERRVVGFRGVAVFNISDTHGKPLAKPPGGVIDGDATPGTYDGLRERVGQAGYSYSEEEIPGCRPATGEGTLGFTQPNPKRVVVDSRLSPVMKATVLAHELGHIHCGHMEAAPGEYQRHRGRMETEAEMTAYLVSRSRGIGRAEMNSLSAGYIAAWAKGDPKVMRGAMDTAVKAHKAIMDGAWPA